MMILVFLSMFLSGCAQPAIMDSESGCMPPATGINADQGYIISFWIDALPLSCIFNAHIISDNHRITEYGVDWQFIISYIKVNAERKTGRNWKDGDYFNLYLQLEYLVKPGGSWIPIPDFGLVLKRSKAAAVLNSMNGTTVPLRIAINEY